MPLTRRSFNAGCIAVLVVLGPYLAWSEWSMRRALAERGHANFLTGAIVMGRCSPEHVWGHYILGGNYHLCRDWGGARWHLVVAHN